MSGHSKWANIRVKKTAEDAKRGKVFTKHARLIEIAARSGSPDPATNASLRTAIENAREDNVPNANIERAIKKGSGDLKGEQMAEEVYAAYGPGGAAFLIECLTDNKNRTLSNVRNIATKNGGNFADSSSVVWMFDRKGVITATVPAGKNVEEMELELIDFGAEDVDVSGDTLSVTTGAADWTKVRDFLKGNGFEVKDAGMKFLPNQKTDIKDLETAQKVMAFMEAIEEDDDVSEVHTNADIPESIAAQL